MSTITVGMAVHWTKHSQHGRSVHITVHDGTVEAIIGDMATVRGKNKRKQLIPVRALRPKGEQSYLDELMRGKQATT